MTAPRGVKKVNENIIQNGRTFIITEENTSKYDWNKLPNGTLHVNPITGLISVKLENETTWVPAGIRNDGTICIAKDSRIGYETFTIKTVNNDDGTFTYINKNGEQRHKPITSEGYHVFELEEGSYIKRRNHLDVLIDDTLFRNVESGGLIELTETRFALTEILEENMEITAKYIKVFNIGHPYPRLFVDENEPEDSEYGDFWLDIDATLADNDLGENIDGVSKKISWNDIIGVPTTVLGYGIIDEISFKGHKHIKNDITDFPTSLPANGGNADTVGGLYPGTGANRILRTDASGKIPSSVLPTHTHTKSEIIDFLNLKIEDISIDTSLWIASTTYTEFDYQADVALATTLTSSHVTQIIFNPASVIQADECYVLPSSDTVSGKIRLYAKTQPEITLSGKCIILGG